MVCVDLSREGTVITGNRTKSSASLASEEPMDFPAENASSASPAGGDPDRP
jgi:hypothetical protein